jgi:hypothetical protein
VYGRLHSVNGNGTVTGIHGSEVLSTEAVSSGQTKTLTVSSPTTVNVAADLAFKVTFKNSGNSPEANVPVTLTVSVFGKVVAPPQANRTQKVLSIAAGETKTVTFSNLNLPPSAFGANATVNVVVSKVPGETVLSNNHYSYPVFFSLPSNG